MAILHTSVINHCLSSAAQQQQSLLHLQFNSAHDESFIIMISTIAMLVCLLKDRVDRSLLLCLHIAIRNCPVVLESGNSAEKLPID